MKKNKKLIALISLLFVTLFASAQYAEWDYSGEININTTPSGADLPEGTSENNFPLLVELYKDFFDFNQAKADGADIRFSADNLPLSYQIELWDAIEGKALIWVRIPTIMGNTLQVITMHWGNGSANSESNSNAVFNNANGYVSVFHLDDLEDEVGTVSCMNVGSESTSAVIGNGRYFDGNNHMIDCGDDNTGLPSNDEARTTQAWIYAESVNTYAVTWGDKLSCKSNSIELFKEQKSFVRHEGWWCRANGETPIINDQWHFVSVTYEAGLLNVYVDGKLDASETVELLTPAVSMLNIGARFGANEGPWHGKLDELRISNVSRSSNWIKLEYENQKPNQNLVGWVVPSGDEFSVSETNITILEGDAIDFTAIAGGALSTMWLLNDNGEESVFANNRLNVNFRAMRTTVDKLVTLQFKAIYPSEIKTQNINITIKENQPDPEFTLTAPSTWDGREQIEITPNISNLDEMEAKNVGSLNYNWNFDGVAIIKKVNDDSLLLKRSLGSGELTVTLTLNNGGEPLSRSVKILVEHPATDPWVYRTPDIDEKPEDGQFYARDDNGECKIYFNGVQADAETVYMKVFDGTTLIDESIATTSVTGEYSLSVEVEAKLTKYTVEYGIADGDGMALTTVNNLLCGDAILIQGQSNAKATLFGEDLNPETSEWIVTWIEEAWAIEAGFETATHGGVSTVGYWGLELARRIVDNYNVPVFVLNGSKGGTRIDEHQRNDDNPTEYETIYGRTLSLLQQSKLTHGIKAVCWHQGENDQGFEAPTGLPNWVTYKDYFVEMSADWKEDMPNIQQYYIFQIWPDACGGKAEGTESKLREEQRKLPDLYSNMSIMSTLGIRPGSSCHYSAAGYDEFARLLFPLLSRDFYGIDYTSPITPPNIQKIYYTSDAKNEIALEFDQPVRWNNDLVIRFFLDGENGMVSSGAVDGNLMTLSLDAPSNATSLTYLDSRYNWRTSDWDNIIWGENDIAALTFWEVPILTDNLMTADIENQAQSRSFKLYPNPTNKDYITLKTTGLSKGTVSIVDMNGKVYKTLSMVGETIQIPVYKLNAGVYFVRLANEDSISVKKLIII